MRYSRQVTTVLLDSLRLLRTASKRLQCHSGSITHLLGKINGGLVTGQEMTTKLNPLSTTV